MFRIYYDNETGIISEMSSLVHALDVGTYVDIEKEIKINEYKVDVTTKELISLPKVPYTPNRVTRSLR